MKIDLEEEFEEQNPGKKAFLYVEQHYCSEYVEWLEKKVYDGHETKSCLRVN